MLEEVYGRLGEIRYRSEVVEYRVEQHFDWKGGRWVPKKQSAPKSRTIPSLAEKYETPPQLTDCGARDFASAP
jgi:hypothetical protein